jgi:hypothetical protein
MNSSTYLFLWNILEERLPLLDRTHEAVTVDHLVKESLPLDLGLPLESPKFRRLKHSISQTFRFILSKCGYSRPRSKVASPDHRLPNRASPPEPGMRTSSCIRIS